MYRKRNTQGSKAFSPWSCVNLVTLLLLLCEPSMCEMKSEGQCSGVKHVKKGKKAKLQNAFIHHFLNLLLLALISTFATNRHFLNVCQFPYMAYVSNHNTFPLTWTPQMHRRPLSQAPLEPDIPSLHQFHRRCNH